MIMRYRLIGPRHPWFALTHIRYSLWRELVLKTIAHLRFSGWELRQNSSSSTAVWVIPASVATCFFRRQVHDDMIQAPGLTRNLLVGLMARAFAPWFNMPHETIFVLSA